MAWFDEGMLVSLGMLGHANLKAHVEMLQSELVSVLQQLAYALNYVDENNFPNKISGGKVLKSDHSIPLAALNWLEIPITLVAPAQPTSTTASVDCGGFLIYDPVLYPGGTWYFEAALQVSAGGTATAQLKANGAVIGSVSSTSSSWAVVRSSPLSMPSSQAVLTISLSSNNSAYTAYLWAARLIWRP